MADSTYEVTRRNPIYHFGWGIRFYLTGLRLLFRFPSLLVISVIPILATIILLIGIAFGLAWGAGEVAAVFSNSSLRSAIRLITFLLALVGGYFLYLPLARILLAPLSEGLSRRAHALHKGERLVGQDGSWFRAIIEGVKLVGLQMVLVGAAVVVGIVFPPVGLPVGSMLAIFACSLDFFDIPLSVRRMTLREKLRLVGRHGALSFGFGTAAWLSLFVPGINILLLPAGVIGATVLIAEIAPEIQPEIRVPQ